ncbi:MAG TPA: RHS repeat-associated core domain-containing protein, partial [Candidatus Sulfotelmatobacter sp.]|nr:RHS repeat-associated core domain-containing protein [Candidatus Sulfotelmatobacter sp.]
GIMSGQTANSFRVPIPGGAIFRSAADLAVYHPDWLGSMRLESTLGDVIIRDVAYTPYGETYANFGGTNGNLVFAGDFADLYSGLYDTPNRELDMSSGSRWLSPDPALASWNAYAYPTNPNSFIDPQGLYLDGPGQCSIAGGDSCKAGGGGGGGGGGCWDASCGINGVDPSSDCPICTGPYGWLGTANIAAGWMNVISNMGSVSTPGNTVPEFSARGSDGPGPTLLYPGETLANDDPSGDGLPTIADELWMDLGIAANSGFQAANDGTHTTPVIGPDKGKSKPNVPPEWGFCSGYRDGTGAGDAMYHLCMSFPNGPWSNCVRGKLLNQWTPNSNPFQLVWYLGPDHAYDFATCAMQ